MIVVLVDLSNCVEFQFQRFPVLYILGEKQMELKLYEINSNPPTNYMVQQQNNSRVQVTIFIILTEIF